MTERYSQTALKHGDRCLHSLHLYMKHNGGPTSIPKMRGTLLHACYERMLRMLIERGEPTLYAAGHTQHAKTGEALPEDEASAKRAVASMTEAIVSEVRAERTDLHIPAAEADRVRAMLFHLAVANPVDPKRVVAVERKFVLDIGGATVSGKVDVATMTGQHAEVVDVKTALALPSQEEFEDSLQHRIYAVLVCFGQPVTKRPCERCDGRGILDLLPPPKNGQPTCPDCEGTGTIEDRGECIGSHIGHVKAREVYPRYLRDDGTVWEREHTLTRTELNDFRVDLEALVARVLQANAEGVWPAVPGHHCHQCPAPHECPLAEQFLGPRGSEEGLPFRVPVITAQNAADEAERWYFLSEQATALRKAIRGYAKETETDVRFGRDLVLEFRRVDKRSVDRDAMKAAAEDAARFGHPFDPEAYVQVKSGTEFAKRRLSPEEMGEASAAA